MTRRLINAFGAALLVAGCNSINPLAVPPSLSDATAQNDTPALPLTRVFYCPARMEASRCLTEAARQAITGNTHVFVHRNNKIEWAVAPRDAAPISFPRNSRPFST